ncbi:MAG: hypothetical protein OEY18_16855, partial [Candidatus Aminicenantes bacterium]|nr:hypothetical protein [Candidatus Aminicenantes bacterium]
KNFKILFLIIFFTTTCGSKQAKIEKFLEDGVEVVINHLEPYRIEGEPSTLELETVMTIDMEREDIVGEGMGEAGEFDIDGEGNIYVVAFKNTKNFVYRFNRKGDLLNSFGRYGQGPGELEWPFLNRVFNDGRIALTDLMRKYKVFDKDGRLIREIHPEFRISYVFPFENGNFLVEKPRYNERPSRSGLVPHTVSLCDSNFKEIKELDRHQWTPSNERIAPVFMWRVSAGHIYISNEERGYEILDYDWEGNLQRKIRKSYLPVEATEEIKIARLGPGYKQSGISHDRYFPNPLPPLSSFFVDDEGRLFVMTYEAGNSLREYMYDLFNANGVFIGRKSLNMGSSQFISKINYAKIRKGFLYYYREKESGYKELMVQRVIWKN